jgi:hypothetical protein
MPLNCSFDASDLGIRMLKPAQIGATFGRWVILRSASVSA